MLVEVSRATSSSDSSRGVNRVPAGTRGDIRSTRKVRQLSRSMSQATRYQRRPVWTSRCGSVVRMLDVPVLSRQSKRSR